MGERTRVYFCVVHPEPDQRVITSIVGVEPDTFRRAGEPVSNRPGAMLRKKSIWTIECGLPESAEFDQQLDALLMLLERNADGVRAAAERLDAGINCYAWRESANPGFHVTAQQTRRLAALGLSIDLDIYVVEPE